MNRITHKHNTQCAKAEFSKRPLNDRQTDSPARNSAATMMQVKYEMILARDSETCFSLRHGWASHGYCSSRFTGWLQWLRTTNNCLPICFTKRRKDRKDNRSEVQTRLVILPTSYIFKILLED